MSSKRSISESNFSDIYYLNEEESTIFWGQDDSISIAEASLENMIASNREVVPIVLRCMKDYTIKLHSTAIKPRSISKCTVLIQFLLLLESYKVSDDKINQSIKHYLECCVTCSSNFTSNARSSLIKTLSARSLYPSIKIITVKGGLSFLIDWLRQLRQLSKPVSKILVGEQIAEISLNHSLD